MNYLELVQKVAIESGVLPSPPASVTGNTGLSAKVVSWVADAYVMIQNSREHWRWMQREFTANLSIGTQRYTGAALSIPRLGQWRQTFRGDDKGVSLYDPAIGPGDEGPLLWTDWQAFYETQLRNVRPANKPIFWSVSPAGELVVSPTPDKAYVIRGQYYLSPQRLSANTDVPEMPDRYHDLIWMEALSYLNTFDEAVAALQLHSARQAQMQGQLLRSQLPTFSTAADPVA